MDTPDSGNQPSKDSSVREIFLRALEKTSAQGRRDFLDDACGINHSLRSKVEALLEKHRDDGFLEQPAIKFERADNHEGGSSERAGTLIDRYKLLEKLGEGGFGSVWVAEQKEPVKRHIALKIIKMGMDTKQVVARFEAERQALAMMDHPNIAKVFDAGATETGRPYFVMELVRGIPITEYCDKEKLTTEDRLDLFIKVCHAVQHAHQKGIIHRDLKPSNILVTSHDGVPVPKVIDFGIAKATHQELTEKTIYTKLQEFIGTPSYMSPEQTQLSGLDIDTRSDIYSLGVLLYELLTGSTPFDSKELLAAGLDEMRKIIREKEPVRPSTRISQSLSSSPGTSPLVTHHSSLATDLDWIVMKCLEKERTRRYDTATGLANDLLRHLKHEPIVARPPSKAYRLQKSWQRNKLVYTAGAAVALALLAGIAASTWQASVATRAKAEKAREAQIAQTERTKAEEKRMEAEKLAIQLQHSLAQQLLLRGQELCEQGKVADGLHWMVRASEKTPPQSQALQRGIQNNLKVWSRQWVEPETHLIHDTATIAGIFSPNSEQVITGSWNGDLTLWSVPTGRQLWRVNTHDGKQIYAMAFSSDGKRILSRGEDQKNRLWSTETGAPLGLPMGGGGAKFTQDGQSVIFVSGEDNTARRFSALTGEPLSPPQRFEDETGNGAFGSNGRLKLIAGANSTSAVFWDIETLQAMKRTLDGFPGGKIELAALDPSGEKVAAVCQDGSVHVWSVTTGERLFVRRHHKRIRAAVFSPDGERLLTASDDGTARFWNTETGDPVGGPMQHDAAVYNASFSPDGGRIVTASLDACARAWSAETAEPLGRPLRHQDNWVMSASFSPDNKHILTLTGALVAYVWDATETEVPIRRLDSGEGTSTARFSPNGRWVATGNHSGSDPSGVKIFDPITRERVAQDLVHSGGVWSVCFSPDGRYLATGGGDGKARIWDVETQNERFSLQHTATVRGVTYSADGKLIATGSFDGTARIWSASNGEPLSESLPHPGFVEDVAFGENEKGGFLVTACADGLARVWSVASSKEILPPLEHGAALLTVDIGLNDTRIATGGHDKIVKLWKVSDGKPKGVVLVHDGLVEDVTFSQNGRWLLTTSRDATVRLWSVETGEQIGPSLLSDPSAGPWESCFSPDEKQVAIADYLNGTIMVELPGPLDQPHPDPRLWIEVITRMEMDEHGTLTSIKPDDWRAKSEQLAAQGGSPIRQR